MPKKKTFKDQFKKLWNFIWYEDSLASWVVNIILAFIIIKFIVYPFLGFALGTSLPVVAVVSESMEHDGDFETWWNSPAHCQEEVCTQELFYAQYNITKNEFKDYIFKNGFNKGDIIILYRANNLEIGEVITFKPINENSYPIIHRIINIENNTYQTKGDHNIKMINKSDHLNEYNIRKDDLIGKALFKIPYLGYIKLIFTDIFIK